MQLLLLLRLRVRLPFNISVVRQRCDSSSLDLLQKISEMIGIYCRKILISCVISSVKFPNQRSFCTTVFPPFDHLVHSSFGDFFILKPYVHQKPYFRPTTLPFLKTLVEFSSSPSYRWASSDGSPPPSYSSVSHGSPHNLTSSRVQKLVASQTDALLAVEIFEVAARQEGFRHNYSTYHTVICKLGRARQFKAMEALIQRMKKDGYVASPGLFAEIIEIYGEAKMPNQAITAFHQMLEFDCKPMTKHINILLNVLIENKRLESALSLFANMHELGLVPSTRTYNILMKAQCHNDSLSTAYALFNQMHKQGCLPDVDTYSILMQGLCRKSQVKTAVNLLDEMLNKGYVPNVLTYTTLLNSLCRKKKLREAYRLLNKMKVMGCNPDIINYNTVITGFCREGRALDACQIFKDMPKNGCLPNMLSYRTLISGLCNEGKFYEAKEYLDEMISKGFTQHVSLFHLLITGFCSEGRVEEACKVLHTMAKQPLAPHVSTWSALITVICDGSQIEAIGLMDRLLKNDWRYNWDTQLQGSVMNS